MRALPLLLAGLLLALQVRLWFGEGSMPDVWRLEQAIAAQQAENDRLGERNAALAADVRDLRDGLAAVEERARRELGMIRRGESFYRIVQRAERP